jgi:adenine deaminase
VPDQTSPLARTSPELLASARGDAPCELAFTGAFVFNAFTRAFEALDVGVKGARIARVAERGSIQAERTMDCEGRWIVPGFIDAHMHVESTMLPPSQFVRLASPHGTTAAVFDPHEIANVLGAPGIRWIIDDARGVPIHALWGVSSCVPSAPLENSGAALDASDLKELFDDPEIGPHFVALAEMMNFPGVVHADPEVLKKVALGLERRIVDGHAPGLSGPNLQAYVAAGISSDHECTTLEEAQEKLALGQRVFIREGSAARNLEALVGIITPENAHRICFCTDDRHPDDLLKQGHIDHVVRRAIALGVRPEIAFAIASLHAAEHYRQPDLGAIAPGRFADLLVLSNRDEVRIEQTWFRGELVAEAGAYLGVEKQMTDPPAAPVHLPEDFSAASFEIRPATVPDRIRVIGMHPDQLVTDALVGPPTVRRGTLVADPDADLLKLAVIERHRGTGNIGLGFVTGFGFRGGAMASTVGHDAHNLAIVGDNDADMVLAATTLADCRGGQCVVAGGEVLAVLPLPIAGLMSDQPAETVISQQSRLLEAAASLGCPHHDPFMPLSFLPLPVIPKLKLTDLGLVDVDRFEVVPLAFED